MTYRRQGLACLMLLAAAVAQLAAGCGGTAPGTRPAAPAAPAGGTARPPEHARAGGTGPAATGRAAAGREGTSGHGAGSGRGAGTPRGATAAGRQIITVTAPHYGDTYATFSAWSAGGQGSRGRHRVFGPWAARIGREGFAPPGGKREGDGRTPSGSFTIPFLFGAGPHPGVRLPYRRIHAYDFWDDDPASPRYNEWVDTRRANPGANPEPMDVSAYDLGAVIGYNTARTPGLGSAIFLHDSIGIATAGCVTLPARRLLAVLRWLNPARSPRIRMGVR